MSFLSCLFCVIPAGFPRNIPIVFLGRHRDDVFAGLLVDILADIFVRSICHIKHRVSSTDPIEQDTCWVMAYAQHGGVKNITQVEQ